MNLLESIIAVIVGISTLITASALGVKWLTKHYFEEIKHELKPNSGTSIKDQVTRMESEIIGLKKQNENGEEFHKRLDNKIDHLTDVFIDYISKTK